MLFRQADSRCIHKIVLVLIVLLFTLSSTGCTEYWWTRGQPPSVSEMIARAQTKLTASRKKHGTHREKVGAASEQIELSLHQAVVLVQGTGTTADVAEQLSVTEQAFIELDTNVSVGSRAALGELSGQLRNLSKNVNNGTMPEFTNIGLFTARTLSFLASELEMPKPTGTGTKNSG